MASEHLQRNTVIGLVVSLLLAGGKFVAGVFGHSSALVADAVESLADTIGSVVVWQGLRIANRPPDAGHPYGYGKAEALAVLSVGALLIAAAVVIVVRAVEAILTPHEAPAPWTLGVLAVVVAAKEGLFRMVLRDADMLESDAARADAWHHRADAVTSATALVGVAIAVWGPRLFAAPRLVFADEAAAIIASGLVLFTAVRLMKPALHELLDATSPVFAESVRATAAAVEGVRLVEKVHARKSGRGYHVDMHLHVAPEMPVHDAHALAGKVKAILRATHANLQHVLIHVEPAEAGAEPGRGQALR